MASRLSRAPWAGALTGLLLLSLAACTSTDRPSVQGQEMALPTPLRSWGPSMTGTVAALEAALTAAGSRLVDPPGGYRPSEPPSLLLLPRVVKRADLADPGDGYVVIYETAGAAEAGARARELADHLGSGFGQTNFPVDSQFSVAVLDDTVIFSTWSRGRSADPDRAQAAFDAVASVGEAMEVRK